MDHVDLLPRVRELRSTGLSQKQIARELGMRPAQVAPLLRQLAGRGQRPRTETELPAPHARPLAGCWINPGWSTGLDLSDAPAWRDLDPEGSPDPSTGQAPLGGGLVGVMVARAERSSRVTLCGFLVDVYCLGVKDTIGPLTVSSSAVLDRTRRFFTAFRGALPRSIPVELARDVVHGAVTYARDLGFEPHAEFTDTAPYLGPLDTPSPIRFGHDGKPFYISGPYDDTAKIMDTLNRTRGQEDFHFVTHVAGPH